MNRAVTREEKVQYKIEYRNGLGLRIRERTEINNTNLLSVKSDRDLGKYIIFREYFRLPYMTNSRRF